MKNKIKLIPMLILSMLLASCTEKISIDLNSSDPQIVIEGVVATNGAPSWVKISKSVNFDDSNDFPVVQGAVVTISDNLGNTVNLYDSVPGYYQSPLLNGVYERIYYLTVETGEKTLTSISTIPARVAFDSLVINKLEGGGGGPGSGGHKTNYELKVRYTDPAGTQNYYRFVEIINGEIKKDYVFDDRLNDGAEVENTLNNKGRTLNHGDTVCIEMQCIDKPIYDYFNSFSNLNGGMQGSSTPANPYTNINGSKLGYFSAHTVEVKQVVIQ